MSCSYHSYCLPLTTPPRSRRAGDALPPPPSPQPASTSLVADTTRVCPPQSASTWLTTLQHLYPLSTLEHAFSTAFSTIDAAPGSPFTSYVSSQPASLSSIFADEALPCTAYLDAAESTSSTAVDTVNLPIPRSLMTSTWLTHPYVHLSALE